MHDAAGEKLSRYERIISMKCSNCGAEIGLNAKFCEYCGSAITAQMRQEQNEINKAGCPKCGSPDISFSREKQGEVMGKDGLTVVWETVGVCEDCGYTWRTDGGAKPTAQRKTWLWVLGWIFVFPLPLTILMLHSKQMKPALKYAIIISAWVVYLLIGLSAE